MSWSRPLQRVALVIVAMGAATPSFAGDSDKGRAIYVARCQACHGADGSGDGPASGALPRKPRDMRQRDFWREYDNAALEAIIASGRPGTAMRGFPMDPAQMKQLVAYLRTFQPR